MAAVSTAVSGKAPQQHPDLAHTVVDCLWAEHLSVYTASYMHFGIPNKDLLAYDGLELIITVIGSTPGREAHMNKVKLLNVLVASNVGG